MEFYFNVSFLLLLVSSCIFNSSSSEKTQAANSEFHILDLSNRLSKVSFACNRNSTATTTGTSKNTQHTVLELVHKQGPCANHQNQKNQVYTTKLPSVAEIFRQDQFRIKFIQTQLNPKSTNTNELFNVPVQSSELLNSGGAYIVRLGFGTPTLYMHLLMDTGSHVTWTQCEPCSRHCYKQHDNIFNPLKSKSYSNILCIDRDCPLSDRYRFACYHNVTCMYGVIYGDQSYTIGFLGKDTLNLTKTNVLKKFIFGCGQNNIGQFGEIAGVLSLSKHPLSLISQIAPKNKRRFSYYLPTSIDSTGYLTLGKKNDDTNESNVRFTPFIACPSGFDSLYCIEMISITIGRTKLQIKQSVFKNHTIVDSGTTITYLPHEAYKAMSKEFNQQMDKTKYPVAPGEYDGLDTCYNIGKHKNITFPKVAFTFKEDVIVNIDPSGTLILANSTVACLAFAELEVSIFGNLAQMKHEVVYDVSDGKLGFGPSCG